MFEKEQEQIIASLHGKKSAQSWIVIGPKGIGKELFAKNLISNLTHVATEYNKAAKWITCGLTESAKNEIQKAILAGKSIDEKNWAKKQHITVDDVREGCKFLALTSDDIRILVFNLADDMNENAQNALLKTLEEPYPNTLILLLCENIGHLLPTILSRCKKLYLAPPPKKEFTLAIQKTHPDLSDQELNDLAFLSSNIIGLAEYILEKNGLDIYQKVLYLLQNTDVDTNILLDFAEESAKDNDLYLLVKDILLKQLAFYAEQAATRNLATAFNKSILYTNVKKLLDQTESINLDKKQVLISVIHQIRENS